MTVPQAPQSQHASYSGKPLFPNANEEFGFPRLHFDRPVSYGKELSEKEGVQFLEEGFL